MREPSRTPRRFGERAEPVDDGRAEAPRAPALPPTLERAEVERTAHLRTREVLERRSILRGLILLALLALVVSLAHAGLGRAFFPGWWRQW